MRTPAILACLFVLLAPVACVWLDLLAHPAAWAVYSEVPRLGVLFGNTLALAGLASVVSFGFGVPLALALERTRWRGQSLVDVALMIALFVPLPVWAIAWQAVFQSVLPSLTLEPGTVAWRAWRIGLVPAAWVHGVAAIPWVVGFCRTLLRTAERSLEDDATMLRGPRSVWRLVLWPRLRPALLLGLAWVLVQCATEIAVTDAMMVQTLAEEAYAQLVAGLPGVQRTLALILPCWIAAIATALLLRPPSRWPANVPTLSTRPPLPRLWVLAVWVSLSAAFLLPLSALILRAAGVPPSLTGFGRQCVQVATGEWRVILQSLAWCALSAWGCAALARQACWRARQSSRFGWLLAIVCLALFLLPAPVLGLGLKRCIASLVDLETRLFGSSGPFAALLYELPSPLPAMWAWACRGVPVACLLLWPAVQAIPQELLDAGRLDGHTPALQQRLVLHPATRSAFLFSIFTVTGLSLAEVGASKLVVPPGADGFILRLFAQMHYGAEATVAALSLLQLAASAIPALAVIAFFRGRR